MTIPLESLEIGKCYLSHGERGPRVLRVLALLRDGRVQYEYQNRYGSRHTGIWKPGLVDRAAFARLAEREIPCDWCPDAEGIEFTNVGRPGVKLRKRETGDAGSS